MPRHPSGNHSTIPRSENGRLKPTGGPTLRLTPLIAALCLFPCAAFGVTFSAPLPDLVGPVRFSVFDGGAASFDFGQQFSHIENVWIEIEARVSAQQFDVCGTVFD